MSSSTKRLPSSLKEVKNELLQFKVHLDQVSDKHWYQHGPMSQNEKNKLIKANTQLK